MSDHDAALYIRTDGRRRFVDMAAAVGFVILWSSGTIFADLGLRSANALSFLALRLLSSAVIMWGICLAMRPKFPETSREWIQILLTGLLLQAAYQTFFFYSLELGISPGLLAIVLGVQPLVTAVITARHVRRVEWLGLVLGLVGLCVSVGCAGIGPAGMGD
jgi:drug/metabolite transporter (DMT)-like permease